MTASVLQNEDLEVKGYCCAIQKAHAEDNLLSDISQSNASFPMKICYAQSICKVAHFTNVLLILTFFALQYIITVLKYYPCNISNLPSGNDGNTLNRT